MSAEELLSAQRLKKNLCFSDKSHKTVLSSRYFVVALKRERFPVCSLQFERSI